MTIYYIGGSPCSGKSTVAAALAETCGLTYFKVDDHLDRYMQMGASDQKVCCAKLGQMTPEQIWMREPAEQCKEELQIYEEIFEYVLADLKTLDSQQGIITEGAAFLPKLAKHMGIPQGRYLSITPTKEFQVFHYRQREWVPYVLQECSDKAKAFDNWMERDALFAKAVQQQCDDAGYVSIVNNGEIPVETLTEQVAAHFGLERS
ncbi:MAG: hypothetical protein E7323_12750 [Clostridiales bacterium]|nr:hypothetical protein [Clostridiales bacterium]